MEDALEEDRRKLGRDRNRQVIALMVLSAFSSVVGLAQCRTNSQFYQGLQALKADVAAIKEIQTNEAADRAERKRSFDLFRSQLQDRVQVRDGEIDVIKRQLALLEAKRAVAPAPKKP